MGSPAKNPWYKKPSIIVSGALVFIVAISFWASAVIFDFEAPFKKRAFDRQAWFDANASEKHRIFGRYACDRGSMAWNLKARHLPKGMTRLRVLKLLGKPGNRLVTPRHCIEYDLGACSSFKMDQDYLQVCFDQRNRLISTMIFQD